MSGQMTAHPPGARTAAPYERVRGPAGADISGGRIAAGRRAGILAGYTLIFVIALPALLWALGGRLDTLLGLPTASGPWSAAGVMALVGGGLWLAWSVTSLRRHGSGWPVSHLPPRRLVNRGPYGLMRHPVYVGYTAAFAGAGLVTGSFGRGLFAPGLLAFGSIVYALGFEEPRLVRRYGAAYRAHRAAVPVFPTPFGLRTRAAIRAAGWRAWSACAAALEPFANRTVLFRVGPSLWVTYGACLAAGAAVMAIGLAAALRAAGLPAGLVAAYILGLAAAMLVGGRVMWLLYQALPPRRMARPLRRVGFVSWGGYIALLAAGVGFARLARVNPLWLLDRTLFWGFLLSGFGRLGCLSYGCCYGRPARHGLCWTDASSKIIREHGPAAAVPRVPTQLLSALLAFGIAAVLSDVSRSLPPAGVVTGIGLLLYALGRFAIDCLRDERRFRRWRLTAGQIGAALTGGLAIALLLTVHGPPGWSAPAYSVPLFREPVLWAAAVADVALVFLICGFHWREVGRW